MSKLQNLIMSVFILASVAAISFVSIKVYAYFHQEEAYVQEEITLSNKEVEKQRVIEKERVLLESKKVVKLVGYEEKNKKEYEYRDNEFYLEMTKVKANDNTFSKVFKNAWNKAKKGINNVGERRYYQVGYYEVAYGLDAQKDPIEVLSVDEETGIVKIKEPKISMLYFSMPFDDMEIEVEDQTNLSKGKLKITKEFTTKDKQKLYEELVIKAKKELEKTQNELAMTATKEAIRNMYSQIDENIIVEFVK